MMDGEVDLLIVCARFVLALDEQKAELSAIGPEGEVGVGGRVGVIPAGAGGPGSEAVAEASAGAIIGEPSSIAPSLSESMARPCQWTMSWTLLALATSMTTGTPSRRRSSGPGSCPL